MFQIEDNAITITRGDSARIDITVYDAHGEEYELQEGDALVFTVKSSVNDKEKLIQKSGAVININPQDTQDLDYGKYVYDVQITLANGTVNTIIEPSVFKIASEVSW